MNQEEVHWYYIDESNNDAQVGPFTIRDFKEKFLGGLFTPESYCWHEEIDDWEKLKNIYFRGKPALSYFSEAPPLNLSQDPAIMPPPAVENPSISSAEAKKQSIAQEIKERLMKKYAK